MSVSLCALSSVLLACREPVWSDGNSQMRLTVKDSSVTFATLRDLREWGVYAEQFSDTALQTRFDNDQPGELNPEAVFTLKLPRAVGEHVVARDLSDLLSLDSTRSRVPQSYFLVKDEETHEDFCFTGPSSLQCAPARVKGYHDAIELWDLMKARADHSTSTDSLLFFDVRRTEIMPGFDLSDLTHEIPVATVRQFLDNEEKPETRREIFRSVLSEFLRDQPPARAFADLLRRSDLFVQRLSEGWRIYLSTNSPERLTEEAVAKHLGLAEKLEKIIGGMEAKSLTIPAAVLLAVKEVRVGAGWTTLNTMILAASSLYLAAMTVGHFSQRATLELLKTTIDRTTADLKSQGLEENNPVLKGSFGDLAARRRNSSLGSWAMWIFSWVPLIAVWYAIFCATPVVQPPADAPPRGATSAPANQAVVPPDSRATTAPAAVPGNTEPGK